MVKIVKFIDSDKVVELIENLCAFLMKGWKSVHALGLTCE